MRISIEIGRRLQEERPEILDMLRQGNFLMEIAEKVGITNKVTRSIAKTAICYALRGYSGRFGSKGYRGLARIDELDRIRTARQSEMGRVNGSKCIKNKIGIFSLDQKTKDMINKLGGIRSYEKGVGIHSMKHEERVNVGRMSVAARGETLWKGSTKRRCSEIEFVIRMRNDPENLRAVGEAMPGHPNWRLIADKVNREYHSGKPVRTPGSVYTQIYRHARRYAKGR